MFFSQSSGETQVADSDASDHYKEKNLEAASHVENEQHIENVKLNSGKGNGIRDKGFPQSSPRSIDINHQIGNSKLGKRGMKAHNVAKRAKRDKVQGSKIQSNLREECVKVAQHVNDCNDGSSVLKTRSEKLVLGNCATEPEDPDVLVPDRAEIPDQGGKKGLSELPASFGKKQGSDEEFNLKKTRTTSRKINGRNCLRSKRQNKGSAEVNVLEKVSAVQDQTNEDAVPKSSFKSVCLVDDKETCAPKEKTSRKAPKKRKIVSFSGMLKGGSIDDNLEVHSNDSAKGIPSTETVKGDHDFRFLDDSSRVKKVLYKGGMTLSKCETLPNKIQCSFCHSSEDTEVSLIPLHC